MRISWSIWLSVDSASDLASGSCRRHSNATCVSFSAVTPRRAAKPTNCCSRPGDAEAIDQSCRDSKVGKLLPDALYVHRSALDALEPLLRIYEGCARAYLGEIDEANLIKLHRHSGKVSYLAYPDFETDPHPPLVRSVKLSLRTRELECFDYASISNPPILHRKEAFLHPSHSLYDTFARLSEQEDNHGLLSEPGTIGTRDGWSKRLEENGFTLRGHRLVRLSGGEEPGHNEGPEFTESGDAALDLSSS